MVRPQRQGAGGDSPGGAPAAPRGRRLTIPAPANDNRLGLLPLALRLLSAAAAIALGAVLIRYVLG
ncbi:MAG TPA: hypothetical protein VMU06_21940 [Stellaceae bacterium]|nr:hypothetical protein [Stellaceae bacterium]